MSELYEDTHRVFQEGHDSRGLADRLEQLAHREFDPDDRAFIEAAPFFFLSTVDHHGRPTVSYKGGRPGFVKIAGPGTLVFPAYDGNGMFLSLGNIEASNQVGLLFIDFESPRRLRIQGAAQVIPNEGPCSSAGALYLVRVEASHVFVNCGRYIHRFRLERLSPHVPDERGHQPFPAWKRLDVIADSLSDADQRKVRASGGPIPLDAYRGEDPPDRH